MSKAMSLQNGHSKQQKADANSHAKRPTTILDEIFSFQFRSRVTCCSCGRVSDTIEHNNTWPVDVKHNNDIRKGMIQFMREDILDGHNAYKCNK
jgi:ubiquitin C-terminal hydrolase